MHLERIQSSAGAAPTWRWPALCALAYAGLLGFTIAAAERDGGALGVRSTAGADYTRPELAPCLLRRVSGVPCPTCGSTRMLQAVGRGEWRAALHLNPLMFAAGWVAVGVVGMRIVGRRRLRLATAAGYRRAAAGVVLVVLLNWAWVLRTGV